MPGRPGWALASMGIYVFRRDFLFETLEADAANPQSRHDFGRDVLPGALHGASVQAFPFRDPATGQPGYWRDIGTVERYWQANMDLLDDGAGLDLHDPSWPIWTRPSQSPPVRFGADGAARNSIVASGCRIDGTLEHSIASTSTVVGRGAFVESSVLLPGARVGRRCVVRNAIVDSACEIPDDTIIDAIDDVGLEHGLDDEPARRGIVVVTRGPDRRAPQTATTVLRVA
jgi:glucose-1-phosphate adenylyltransferase